MAIDVKTPQSPGWWLNKCAKKLQARQPRLNLLADYHDGNPPLPTEVSGLRDAVKTFQRKSRTNFAELIVGAVRERLAVRAIRTAAAADLDGDDRAWEIWRDNNLDIEFGDVLENMLALGDAYMIVGLDPDDSERVIITGEDPRQVVTIHNPVRQSEVRAAAKMFWDPDQEKEYAFLYLPGEWVTGEDGSRVLTKARRYVASRQRKSAVAKMSWAAAGYDWDEDFGGADGEELNHTVVPVVRFRNRRGIGEFETHIDILDRINLTVMQRMVIAAYQAFRMHALQVDDDDMPDEDENGQAIDYDDVLTADPGAFIKIPANAKIWESAQADLSGILNAIKGDVQHLMAVTRTPLSATDAINQSAEGAALIKEGQIFKTEDKQKRSAGGLALVYMIAFMCLGDEERAEKSKIVVDWAPSERYSLQQKYDAASKAPTSGVPNEMTWTEVLQFTPEQVALARAAAWDQAIREDVNGQPAAAPGTSSAGRLPAAGGGVPSQS